MDNTEFNQFLVSELAIPGQSIAVALKGRHQDSDPLPMLLWQYGLISISELQRIFDWLEVRDLQEFNAGL